MWTIYHFVEATKPSRNHYRCRSRKHYCVVRLKHTVQGQVRSRFGHVTKISGRSPHPHTHPSHPPFALPALWCTVTLTVLTVIPTPLRAPVCLLLYLPFDVTLTPLIHAHPFVLYLPFRVAIVPFICDLYLLFGVYRTDLTIPTHPHARACLCVTYPSS